MATNAHDIEIGKKLTALRGDMTQDELAKRMKALGYKWSQATVWSIEQGTRPLRLSEALDVCNCISADRIEGAELLLFLVKGVGSAEIERRRLHQKVVDAFEGVRVAWGELEKLRRELAEGLLQEVSSDNPDNEYLKEGRGWLIWSSVNGVLEQHDIDGLVEAQQNLAVAKSQDVYFDRPSADSAVKQTRDIYVQKEVLERGANVQQEEIRDIFDCWIGGDDSPDADEQDGKSKSSS